MKLNAICIAALSIAAFSSELKAGGVATEATKAVGKAIGRKLGAEAVEAGIKTGAKKLVKEIAEEGAEGVVRKAATTQGLGEAVRLASKSLPATSVASATIKQGVAVGLKQVSSQSARRLQMMAGEIEATGKGPELLNLISKHSAGDKIVDFLWRNKATLAGGAIVATLIANPDATIAAGTEIVTETIHGAGQHVVQPVIDGSIKHVVAPTVQSASIGAWIFFYASGLTILAVFVMWLRTGNKLRDICWWLTFTKMKT